MQLGDRLREERERLGFKQSDFAALAGSTRKTQFNYESGERNPDAAYLQAILGVGADVLYILTGRPGVPAMTPEQERAGYVTAVLSPAEWNAIQALRSSGALIGAPAEKKQKQVVHGSVGQLAGGDVVNQEGARIEIGTKSGGRRKR